MVVVVRSYWPQSLYCQMDKTGDCGRTKNRALAPHERSAVPLGTDHCPVG